MKRFKSILITLSLAILALSLYLFWPGRELKITINEGAGAAQAAQILKREGVIISATWFKILVKLTGTGKRIMPGEYSLRRAMSAEEALWRLVHNNYINHIKLNIPEGWRAEQIAERLESNGVTKAEQFLALVRQESLEGMLFPSTYYFKKNTPAREAVNLLKSEFDRRLAPLFSKGFPQGLDEKKTLIIASIVEREAVDAAERPLIAAVYINRYRKKMALEADPTVQYALGYWKKGITLTDLRVKSPYNTYAVGGLPPGPICNPGYDSVAAVLAPAEIDALYFVADRKGTHIFNANFKEHLKAKKRVEQAARGSKIGNSE
ncbi:MAG TPA: endolytic transglycosylase MltG [Elusimicrobia bacterium]|nr:endolytic transglycosylase MltG [Elusimicrobiota bacterium]